MRGASFPVNVYNYVSASVICYTPNKYSIASYTGDESAVMVFFERIVPGVLAVVVLPYIRDANLELGACPCVRNLLLGRSVFISRLP